MTSSTRPPSFFIPSAPYSSISKSAEKEREGEGLPVCKSVGLINEKETFLGLEGPLIFVPALVFFIVHHQTRHFYFSAISFVAVYLFIRIFLRDKPPHFLRFIFDYQRIPKIYEHRFFNVQLTYNPLSIFEEETFPKEQPFS
ncbi:hypothetical protein [Candidatus Methylacidiphilum infernorum]|uniref:Uncharacterized protein n=1 Tax=Methylacidiphilum infernorum (isolate V4) TaxID=481448 RepID=B3DV99_METI4|nr:hypothetical protein [Candidatus Methylacidiphilum infernorum]ACD83252.1 Hypothetical protein Minf_1197 [Methylacidiphilum infernorum V4]